MPQNPNYDLLPPHIRGGVKRYIEEYIPPGDFLQQVICNKLKESFMRADDINTSRMWNIVNFFYNEAPMNCWGSKEKMQSWLQRRFFKRGTQIVYVPSHISSDDAPECEEGFVTSIGIGGAFCRYWSKTGPGLLRTRANSEMTPFLNLIIKDTHFQEVVDTLLKEIEEEK